MVLFVTYHGAPVMPLSGKYTYSNKTVWRERQDFKVVPERKHTTTSYGNCGGYLNVYIIGYLHKKAVNGKLLAWRA
jgi:hypothetical protein